MTKIKPCENCGGPYPSFHVSLVRTHSGLPAPVNAKANAGMSFDAHMGNFAEEQLATVSLHQAIINIYKTGSVSIEETARLAGVGKGKAQYVLTQAYQRGEVVMRTRGGRSEGTHGAFN